MNSINNGFFQAISKLTIPTQKGIEFVKINDIIAITAQGNYSKIVLLNEDPLMTSVTLKDFEEKLPKELFFRSHRSCFVNIKYIKRYINKNGGVLVLENDLEIQLARRKKDQLILKMEVISA